MEADTVYLNVDLSGPTDPAAYPTVAERSIQRSGSIIDDPSKYALAVFQLAMSYDQPVWIPRLSAAGLVDGVTTEYSITLTAYQAGVMYAAPEFLKLQKLNPIAQPNGQPKDEYAYVWTMTDVVEIFNDALSRAYNQLLSYGLTIIAPGQAPYFTYNASSNLLAFNAYPYSLYHYTGMSPSGDRVEVWTNNAGSTIVGAGFSYDIFDFLPSGMYALLKFGSLGPASPSGYVEDTPTPPQLAEPSVPSTAKLVEYQQYSVVYPATAAVYLLHSGLPLASEGVPGRIGAAQSAALALLTTFVPDRTAPGWRFQEYNASWGDCRLHELNMTSPLSAFSLSLYTEDWMGHQRPLMLYGNGERCTLKLAFIPKAYLTGGVGSKKDVGGLRLSARG